MGQIRRCVGGEKWKEIDGDEIKRRSRRKAEGRPRKHFILQLKRRWEFGHIKNRKKCRDVLRYEIALPSSE